MKNKKQRLRINSDRCFLSVSEAVWYVIHVFDGDSAIWECSILGNVNKFLFLMKFIHRCFDIVGIVRF